MVYLGLSKPYPGNLSASTASTFSTAVSEAKLLIIPTALVWSVASCWALVASLTVHTLAASFVITTLLLSVVLTISKRTILLWVSTELMSGKSGPAVWAVAVGVPVLTVKPPGW